MKKIELEIYSPVQQVMHPLLEQGNVNLFLKRDDLIHPLISGNKWRKLKYVLARARQQNKNHLVTFGGAYSNHLLATAAAAALFGFKCTGIVRGEKVDNTHLFLCRLHGMELQFTDRQSYRDKLLIFEQAFGDDKDVFFIDEGGASAEAALGCSDLVEELTATYDHLFCACGTGTTAAGIINGLAKAGLNTKFNGVPVFKNGGFIAEAINQYLNEPTDYLLHLDYHFGGYAKTTPALIAFVENFIQTTGILIEPIYTGKMLYGVFDLVQKNYFAAGSNILAIHTGGVLGLLGKKDEFTIS
jgi:1-aminocyclopropane-1-carboxylate deaminase